MQTTTADVVNAFRELPVQERRDLLSNVIREFASQDGPDEAIRLLYDSIFNRGQSPDERQVETVAALMRLPKEVAAALLEPFDPNEIRVEDCLSDEEVDRIMADKPD